MTLDTLILFVPLAYLVLQWLALRRMQDGWRRAAVFPVIFMAAGLVFFVVGIATNASMASVWLVLGMPVATLYLLFLFPVHWLAARRD